MAQIGRVASIFEPEAELVPLPDDPREALLKIATPRLLYHERMWDLQVLVSKRTGQPVVDLEAALEEEPGTLVPTTFAIPEKCPRYGDRLWEQISEDQFLTLSDHAQNLASMTRTELAQWPELRLSRVADQKWDRAAKILGVLSHPAKLRKHEFAVPLWVFADLSRCDPPRRAIAAVESVSFLGFDLDVTETPLDVISQRCGDILHLIYESPSANLLYSPRSPNGRLVVPLDRAVSALEAHALLESINAALGGVAAPFGPAQPYWPPIAWNELPGSPMLWWGGDEPLRADLWLSREDRARAAREVAYEPSSFHVTDGVLGLALKLAGYELSVRETPAGEEYANCWCPARDSHTGGACKPGDFRVRAPFKLGGPGTAFCFHAGCRKRTPEAWLGLLPAAAVAEARVAFRSRIEVESRDEPEGE